jgi:hypothetical protein
MKMLYRFWHGNSPDQDEDASYRHETAMMMVSGALLSFAITLAFCCAFKAMGVL